MRRAKCFLLCGEDAGAPGVSPREVSLAWGERWSGVHQPMTNEPVFHFRSTDRWHAIDEALSGRDQNARAVETNHLARDGVR